MSRQDRSATPRLAVVGCVNMGKTSLVATLTESDWLRIDRRPGTTTSCATVDLLIDEAPVLTLIDTPGAYPGVKAEERGQAEAIARSTQKCLQLRVPLVSVIVGEGGSGGAVAFATADRVAMLEHSVYSVISPEGCASILWKDAEKMREAAEALRLTAQDLARLGVIDRIIPEPAGGAQRGREETIASVGAALGEMLAELRDRPEKELVQARRKKYLDMGAKGLAA